MISIVLVSHSETLAAGVAELARQMAPEGLAIATAGGTEIPEQPIGTDPMKVYAAIESVYSPAGVLVLMDLGSAIMSAEAAIEFLEPEQQERIFLCEGPLVEGAVAAAVAAAGGDPIEQVFAEVRAALSAKLDQLAPLLRIPPPAGVAELPAPPPRIEAAQSLTLTIPNRLGLHARPAARLAGLVKRFNAQVSLTKGERTVPADQLNGLITLGTRRGDQVTFHASGPDAGAVLAAIQALAEENFGDSHTAPQPPPRSSRPGAGAEEAGDGGKPAVPVVAGIGVGPAWPVQRSQPRPLPRSVDEPEAEIERLTQAIHAAQAELRQLQAALTQAGQPQEAAIFEAHALMLADDALLRAVHQIIRRDGINSEAAWMMGIEALADEYRQAGDPYIADRAVDVMDAGLRALRQLDPTQAALTLPAQPAILLAPHLTPGEVARLDPARILGVITGGGGATDHSAILLNGLGIPSVFGAGEEVTQVTPGQLVGLDGSQGRVWLAPTPEQADRLAQERADWLARRDALAQASQQPAATLDGHRVPVFANITGPQDVAPALAAGAEGVGLFRTEFLFSGREQPPSEAEQSQLYAQTLALLGDRPLVVRTLDVGGDKPIPYLDIPPEANPFLGLRGIRYSLSQPDLFATQLRALLRAGVEAAASRGSQPLRVMLPMISRVEEVRAARSLLAQAQESLAREGIQPLPPVQLGIMIEVPSAVALAPELARHVDFFSIGTNDLSQYVMAADRTNAAVAELADARHPAILRMIHQTVAAAKAAGIKVSVCGALAGDPQAAALLVGLGVDELSMAAPAIPPVKAALRGVSLADCQEMGRIEAGDWAIERTESLGD